MKGYRDPYLGMALGQSRNHISEAWLHKEGEEPEIFLPKFHIRLTVMSPPRKNMSDLATLPLQTMGESEVIMATGLLGVL